QGRIVQYYPNTQGQPREVRFNETFDAANQLLTYCKTTYTLDSSIDGSRTHRWLSEIWNSWNWKDNQNAWQSRTLVGNDYGYSAAGLRTSNQISDQNGPVRTETYGYDDLSRLTSVDYGDGEVQAYSFDCMGNRQSKSVNGTP